MTSLFAWETQQCGWLSLGVPQSGVPVPCLPQGAKPASCPPRATGFA